jgi:hypothetical protein
MDAVNNMMSPAGFHEFTLGLHAKPTTFRYGSYSHRSNIEYDYILRVFHTASVRKVNKGWMNYPGSVLHKYLNALGMMLNGYKHTARLCPSPSVRESLPIIHLSDITQDTEEDLIAKYVYSIRYSELGYIKLFKTQITSSYMELGRPPREKTIEGQEARNYMHSLQQNHFGIQKVEKTIHGNPPCIMLANSIRGEDDHRIKAEIIDRLEKTKQQLGIEQLDVVWVTVNSPNTNTKAAAKCITIPKESHTLIPQVIHTINTHQNKTE